MDGASGITMLAWVMRLGVALSGGGLPVRSADGICGGELRAARRRSWTRHRAKVGGRVGLTSCGGVPKWTKGTDCKSVIQGFESLRRLSVHVFIGI